MQEYNPNVYLYIQSLFACLGVYYATYWFVYDFYGQD